MYSNSKNNPLNKLKLKSKILIIAGSDSSGGAGSSSRYQNSYKLRVLCFDSNYRCDCQNTKGVKSVISIPSNQIKNQILYSAKDIKPDAIKIGMLHSKAVVKNVLETLKKIENKKVVLDPVMVAKGGAKLINQEAVDFLKKKLIQNVSLITRTPEAEVLTGIKIKNKEE